ncbi:hypothetical protein B0F90DRAFT_1664594 [Multifurca ochricompacta]|uniref:AAA+ ATPase domain-containing protein n=1 Tax=Multifurca ochricompacta TaxID=376703 RepID=A0AAD4MD78_9AGAM|nr:hypothetical protein B0F90DRAFT_1664594 [Multifurca ochricompacta]
MGPIAPVFKAGRLIRRDSSPLRPNQSTTASKPSQKRKTAADLPQFTSHPTQIKRAKQTIGSHLQAVSPLAERLRPNTLDDFVGQAHLTDHSLLSTVGSIILWGPPGCGKTTLARLLAKRTDATFREVSATVVGINDVRPILDEAKSALQLTGSRTIIFLDEIHRFTRSQQDIFLPFLERGYVQLIGATTENPSFKLNGALLSRCRVFVLERLTDEEVVEIIMRAVARVTSSELDERYKAAASATLPHDLSSTHSSPPPSSPLESPQLSSQSNVALELAIPTSMSPGLQPFFPKYPHVTHQIIRSMASLSAGDARIALSLLEHVLLAPADMSESTLLDSMRRSVVTSYDRTGDTRYNLISALHKSIRGSLGGAALYWLARMLEAGEDPMYIARRLVVCASEDIGMADSQALPLAMAALQACQVIGMPECRINLAHVVTYLSEAPKSTRAYEARTTGHDSTVPAPMRNAPTGLMKELGYGEGYKYQPHFMYGSHIRNMVTPGIDVKLLGIRSPTIIYPRRFVKT